MSVDFQKRFAKTNPMFPFGFSVQEGREGLFDWSDKSALSKVVACALDAKFEMPKIPNDERQQSVKKRRTIRWRVIA